MTKDYKFNEESFAVTITKTKTTLRSIFIDLPAKIVADTARADARREALNQFADYLLRDEYAKEECELDRKRQAKAKAKAKQAVTDLEQEVAKVTVH